MNGGVGYDLAVVGLGYVGLPVAIEAARAGLAVLGYDVDVERIESLRAGRSHIDDLSDADVAGALESAVRFTTETEELRQAEAVVICVPTPLADQVPDLSAVLAAGAAVGDQLQAGQLVVLESTTYPGTTEEVLGPVLEERSGLLAGEDFDLAYSPERIDPGNRRWTLVNTPKLVAGINERSTERAVGLYRKFCEGVVVLSGTREAEMAKLLENTYRHVNIALVNEMAIFCRELGIDIWEAIRGAATKPFGFQAFYPGPGVGGHCIPIDPSYLSHRVRQLGHQFRFVELAQEINAQMPAYVAYRVAELLNRDAKPVKGSRILLLGVAYKADVGDIRETPALEVARRLLALGAELTFCDPYVEEFAVDGLVLKRRLDPVEGASQADAVVLLTAHSDFDLEAIGSAAQAFLDTRGITPPGLAERL